MQMSSSCSNQLFQIVLVSSEQEHEHNLMQIQGIMVTAQWTEIVSGWHNEHLGDKIN